MISDKIYKIIYFLVHLLTIFFIIINTINLNIINILSCIITIIVFNIPIIIEKKLKIDLSSNLKSFILIFIYSSEILGRVNNYYGRFSLFDNYLHIINGFIAASIGFSLMLLFYKDITKVKYYKIFIPLIVFCFSMTNALGWEFFEYIGDSLFNTDMQQDQYIYNINTKLLDDNHDHVIRINNIDYITIHNNNIKKINGYIDIGLNDTMQDLGANLLGAIIYCVLGYFYIIDNKKHNIAEKFMIKSS